MKFELRLKNKKSLVNVTDSVNIEEATKYFIRRKNIDVEAFTAMFEVVEKKSEKDYLNDGYVKANVIKAGSGLRKGMDVMVNAEEYTSLGDDDMLEVIDPKKGKTTIIQKANLKVQI